MQNEIIKTELDSIKKIYKANKNDEISDEQAFEILALQFFCFKTNDLSSCFYNIESSITNGPNDGGIDFIFYNDEDNKVVLGQCKYTESMQLNDFISELNKMSSTIENFSKTNTGSYNSKLKKVLQNALDRLPDDSVGNVEYWIFTTSKFNKKDIETKLSIENNLYSKDMVSVFDIDEINSQIRNIIEKIQTVSEFKISIDKAKNYLEYNATDIEGVMVNISSNSLTKMYNKYKDDGLFDLNIRKYISNKNVDEGIKETLDKERENFWFYNNGLTIACEDYMLDGDKVNLYNFSIVNGGQTTNRIGNYKGDNSQEFFIPCKIIKIKNDNLGLYAKIAEATNSQKPINSRDLKSNSPEMKVLKNWLGKEDIYLEIKRGEKAKSKHFEYSIKNDELGQLLLSFIYQQPGTARSSKKTLFDNNSFYNKLYRVNYEKDPNKKRFILDLIKLNDDYKEIENKLIASSKFKENEKIVLSNGKYVIIALIGLSYLMANNDYSRDNLNSDLSILNDINFTFGGFISNYTKDDYLDNLESLISTIVYSLTDTYETCYNKNEITSVSNLFKTDKKYKENIVKDFLIVVDKRTYKDEFEASCAILKRKED